MALTRVVEILELKRDRSGGHNGVYLNEFGISLNELRPILKELKKDKKITIHDGIHGYLIKLR